MEITTTLYELSISNKLYMHLPFDGAFPLLGIYPEDTSPIIMKIHSTWLFTATLSVIAKYWKQPKCPYIGQWLHKLWFICTMNEAVTE